MSKSFKTRNFASIGYIESLHPNFFEILKETHLKVLISPLHNADINSNGDLKKEHYHILIMFDGPTTPSNAQRIFDEIKSVGCEPVQSLRGYSRYLCHLDETSSLKPPYDTEEVVALNGADYLGLISQPTNKYQNIKEMTKFIKDNQIWSYAQFFDYCSENNENWFRSLCDDSSYIVREYIKSLSYSISRKSEVDSESEVLSDDK